LNVKEDWIVSIRGAMEMESESGVYGVFFLGKDSPVYVSSKKQVVLELSLI
jgi:hypothetical protein